ncbi:MAG: T9SS type A sorting domain-containing protein [Chitinophagaceae bacterium]
MAVILMLLLNVTDVKAQANLNWGSSFSPSWANGNTNGSANNISGSGINCTATASIVGSGSFQQALGSSGAQTPTVSGATFTVPGTTSRLQVTPNYSNNSSYTDIVLTFTSMATNVTFNIVDVDKNNSTSTTYYDRVTVTGTNGVTTYNATLTKYDAVTDPNFLVISGNVANVNTTSGQAGNTASDATDQRGTVTVSFGSAALNSITIRYDNAAGADANPASQAIAVGSVSFNSSTLPVSLTDFSGHRQAQNVVLNWKTQQEVNAQSYSIERSTGSSWETIASVAASGNGNGSADYTYTDINPQGSLLLYRLKQIDNSNNYKYSNIIRITTGTKTTMLSYPSPFTSQVNVSISSDRNQQVVAIVYDALGKMVRSETKRLYTGENNFTLTGLDNLGHGVYYAVIKDESGNLLGRTQLLKN